MPPAAWCCAGGKGSSHTKPPIGQLATLSHRHLGHPHDIHPGPLPCGGCSPRYNCGEERWGIIYSPCLPLRFGNPPPATQLTPSVHSTHRIIPSRGRTLLTKTMTSTDLHDDLEKPNVHHDEIISSMSAIEQKRLIRRIDARLVITMGFLYCISLLDRTNMGAASVAGYIFYKISIYCRISANVTGRMQKDLNMNAANNGYSITSLVFFITYTIFQIPATAIIRKIGPRVFISTIVLLWGAVMIVRLLFLRIIGSNTTISDANTPSHRPLDSPQHGR